LYIQSPTFQPFLFRATQAAQEGARSAFSGFLIAKNKGTVEAAQHIANHESRRTTKLYDRRQDEISLDEVERILI
jgi:S1-C subfamily serine protease